MIQSRFGFKCVAVAIGLLVLENMSGLGPQGRVMVLPNILGNNLFLRGPRRQNLGASSEAGFQGCSIFWGPASFYFPGDRLWLFGLH